MNFAPGKNEESIEVKYTELGAFNNFDAAMENLAALYPSVERIAPEQEHGAEQAAEERTTPCTP
jgi:hypothetical protein